jgi:hypothetical protein
MPFRIGAIPIRKHSPALLAKAGHKRGKRRMAGRVGPEQKRRLEQTYEIEHPVHRPAARHCRNSDAFAKPKPREQG